MSTNHHHHLSHAFDDVDKRMIPYAPHHRRPRTTLTTVGSHPSFSSSFSAPHPLLTPNNNNSHSLSTEEEDAAINNHQNLVYPATTGLVSTSSSLSSQRSHPPPPPQRSNFFVFFRRSSSKTTTNNTNHSPKHHYHYGSKRTLSYLNRRSSSSSTPTTNTISFSFCFIREFLIFSCLLSFRWIVFHRLFLPSDLDSSSWFFGGNYHIQEESSLSHILLPRTYMTTTLQQQQQQSSSSSHHHHHHHHPYVDYVTINITVAGIMGHLSPRDDTTTHHHQEAIKKNHTSFIGIHSLVPRPLRSNAIVIMAQKKHSTYERDSFSMLLESLDLLYENYLSQPYYNYHHENSKKNTTTTTNITMMDHVDIYIFHTGDLQVDPDLIMIEEHLIQKTNKNLSSSSQQQTQTPYVGVVKLVNLLDTVYWRLPPWHKHDHPEKDWAVHHLFPVGYRHMCRWFGILIWNFFEQMNLQLPNCHYRYLLRLDEDSLIHSPISYDIFEYMSQHNYVYGYRMCAYELDYNKLVYNWFVRWQERSKPLRSLDWKLCGFYNNFFVADLAFFTSQRVRGLLKEIDRQGIVYRKRYGDLLIHTLAVYAHAPTHQIHRFLDFTYQHVTKDYVIDPQRGCVVWGGIQAGYNDPHALQTLDHFYQTQVLSKGCKANITTMKPNDLSPSYHHLSQQLQQQVALKTIVAGKVEIPHKGILSG